jgi:hypothetical protein
MRHFEEGSICFVVRCLRGMERLWGLDKREGWGLRLEIPSKSLRVLRKPLPSCTRQGRATTPECELRVLGTPDRGRPSPRGHCHLPSRSLPSDVFRNSCGGSRAIAGFHHP